MIQIKLYDDIVYQMKDNTEYILFTTPEQNIFPFILRGKHLSITDTKSGTRNFITQDGLKYWRFDDRRHDIHVVQENKLYHIFAQNYNKEGFYKVENNKLVKLSHSDIVKEKTPLNRAKYKLYGWLMETDYDAYAKKSSNLVPTTLKRLKASLATEDYNYLTDDTFDENKNKIVYQKLLKKKAARELNKSLKEQKEISNSDFFFSSIEECENRLPMFYENKLSCYIKNKRELSTIKNMLYKFLSFFNGVGLLYKELSSKNENDR